MWNYKIIYQNWIQDEINTLSSNSSESSKVEKILDPLKYFESVIATLEQDKAIVIDARTFLIQ